MVEASNDAGVMTVAEPNVWGGFPEAMRVMPPDAELCGLVHFVGEDGSYGESGDRVTAVFRSSYQGDALLQFYLDSLPAECAPGNSASAFTWNCPQTLGGFVQVSKDNGFRGFIYALSVP